MDALKIFHRLAARTQVWGGSLRIVSENDFWSVAKSRLGWTFPPENGHALHYQDKAIICTRRDMDAGTIVHEMGHVFADLTGPSASVEWDWMGWEFCLAREMGCYRQWSASTRYYGVEWNWGSKRWPAWKDLSARGKAQVIDNRVRHAIETGLVAEDLSPRALR